MSNTFRRLFTTCRTFTSLLIGPLHQSASDVRPEDRAHHSRIERTLFSRTPDILLIGMIQIWRRDFNLGYPDNIFWRERLKLDVLSIKSAGAQISCSVISYILRGTSEET